MKRKYEIEDEVICTVDVFGFKMGEIYLVRGVSDTAVTIEGINEYVVFGIDTPKFKLFKKPWYEDESNFPCLVLFGNDDIKNARIAVSYNSKDGRIYFDKDNQMYSHAKGWDKIELNTLVARKSK